MNPSRQRDQRIYQRLMELDGNRQEGEVKAHQSKSALMTHFILKCIPLGLYICRYLLQPIFSEIILYQLIVIMVVVDFWCTKNITGRKMVGLKWGFEQDRSGVERFKVQSRINSQYTSGTSSLLFWIILIGYCFIPLILIVTTLIIAPNMYRVRLSQILLNVCILIGGVCNLYFFNKARRETSTKVTELSNSLGRDFTKKMGSASLVSYI